MEDTNHVQENVKSEYVEEFEVGTQSVYLLTPAQKARSSSSEKSAPKTPLVAAAFKGSDYACDLVRRAVFLENMTPADSAQELNSTATGRDQLWTDGSSMKSSAAGSLHSVTGSVSMKSSGAESLYSVTGSVSTRSSASMEMQRLRRTMRFSVVFAHKGFEHVFPMELPSLDLELTAFMNIAMGISGEAAMDDFEITINAKKWSKSDILKNGGTMKPLEIKDDDLIIISKIDENELAGTSMAAVELSDDPLTNFIRSIRIPKKKRDIPMETQIQKAGHELYKQLKLAASNGQSMEELQDKMPDVFDIFTKRPDDLGAFLIVYRQCITLSLAKRRRLESGGLDAQRDLEEDIRDKRLDQNQMDAYAETPEAFVEVHMLYIHIKLNGHEVTAFVDTGAQISLISPACAEKCNLTHLINKRFASEIRGVGGLQKSPGMIWRCDMEVGGHELPVSLRVLDGPHEVLLGLDIMLRHRANIDLATRTLVFNGHASTTFLSDAESERIQAAERGLSPDMDNQLAQAIAASEETAMEEDQKTMGQ